VAVVGALLRARPDAATSSIPALCGWTAVHAAAARGSVEVLRALLEKCEDDAALLPTSRGETALMVAAMNGHVDVTRVLSTEYGGRSRVDGDGLTALTLARLHGHTAAASELEASGSIVADGHISSAARLWPDLASCAWPTRCGDNADGISDLHRAAQRGDIEHLRSQQSHDDGHDVLGRSALELSVASGSLECAALMMVLCNPSSDECDALTEIAVRRGDGNMVVVVGLVRQMLAGESVDTEVLEERHSAAMSRIARDVCGVSDDRLYAHGCSYRTTSDAFVHQIYARVDGFGDNEGACMVCAAVCQRGKLRGFSAGPFFCDCGVRGGGVCRAMFDEAGMRRALAVVDEVRGVREAPTAASPASPSSRSVAVGDEVLRWLTSLQLESCVDALVREGYDTMERLLQLLDEADPDAELVAVGIPQRAYRKQLVAALRKRRSGDVQ
jgi:ankyrin repeat protein